MEILTTYMDLEERTLRFNAHRRKRILAFGQSNTANGD
jgi:hypothetical protein